jgi:multiple sugar transport system substrate-binding protein
MINRRDMLKWSAAAGVAPFAQFAATPSRAQSAVTLDVLYAFPAFAKFHEPIAAEFM